MNKPPARDKIAVNKLNEILLFIFFFKSSRKCPERLPTVVVVVAVN